MKTWLKALVVGTFLESPARKLYARFIQAEPSRQSLYAEVADNQLYDEQTVEVMKRALKQDANCIDIGCHQGSVLKEILQCAPKGTHFAFEPLPEMHRALLSNFGHHPSLTIYDVALSDVAGEASFQHVVSNPGYSGLRQRRYDRPNEQIESLTVKTQRLDCLLPRDCPIDFIKVDVEGAELQVFKGAIQTLKSNRPLVVFEHGLGAADHYGTTPEDIYDLLVSQCGLRLFIMATWLNLGDQQPLSKETFCQQYYQGRHYYFLAAP